MSACYFARIRLIALLSLLSFTVAGCKDLHQIDSLNIVLAMGIDETEAHQVRVTAEIVDPAGASSARQAGGGAQRSQATFTREEVGNTVEEAVDKFGDNVARYLFLPHNSIVVFGRAYAERGIDKAMDFLERNRSYRRNQLFIVTDLTASELLKASGRPELTNAAAIRALVVQGTQKALSVNSTQLSVMRQYLRPSHAPNIAYITPKVANLYQGGIGLFDGGQYKDHITSQDAQALLLFLQDTERTEVILQCGHRETPSLDVGNAFRILNTHTTVTPVVRGRTIQFFVRVRGRAEVERLCPGSTTTPESYEEWEVLIAKEIKDRMQRVMTRLQREDVDSVQFANTLFETHPAVWSRLADQWKTTFPTVKVSYDVQIQLLRNGLTSKEPDVEYSPQGLPPRAGRGGPIR